MAFMSEYKHLEKLCSEVMMVDHAGVTAYIDQMVKTPNGEHLVPGWRDDLNALKHYRYIRNQIAHNPDYDEEDLCEPEDEEWLAAFYDRIMNEVDPLTNYRRKNDAARAANTAASRRASNSAASAASTASAASHRTTAPVTFGTHAPNYAAPNYTTNPYFTNPLLNGNYRQPPKRRSSSRRKVLLTLLILLLLFGYGVVLFHLPQIVQSLSSVLSSLRSH